jgi:hypothetical protein
VRHFLVVCWAKGRAPRDIGAVVTVVAPHARGDGATGTLIITSTACGILVEIFGSCRPPPLVAGIGGPRAEAPRLLAS